MFLIFLFSHRWPPMPYIKPSTSLSNFRLPTCLSMEQERLWESTETLLLFHHNTCIIFFFWFSHIEPLYGLITALGLYCDEQSHLQNNETLNIHIYILNIPIHVLHICFSFTQMTIHALHKTLNLSAVSSSTFDDQLAFQWSKSDIENTHLIYLNTFSICFFLCRTFLYDYIGAAQNSG